jgi:hypothetical protein
VKTVKLPRPQQRLTAVEFNTAGCSDGDGHTLGLIGSIEMCERHVHGAMVGSKGALEPAPNGGGFSEAQPAFAPQDSRQFLDQAL